MVWDVMWYGMVWWGIGLGWGGVVVSKKDADAMWYDGTALHSTARHCTAHWYGAEQMNERRMTMMMMMVYEY